MGSILFVALTLAIGAAPSAASVTLGQLGPNNTSCSPNVDFGQVSVSSGNAYQVPGTGTITSWSHSASAFNPQTMTLKIFRKVADPDIYSVVGHDGPRTLAPGLLNTFPAKIAVQAGDLVGLNASSSQTACLFTATVNDHLANRGGSLADGQAAAFAASFGGRLSITAVFEPSNAFTLGKKVLNKKKGTATLNVEVPNPGSLVLGGKGVKGASATGAAISKTVGAAGTVKLVIKAKGKQAKQLKRKGKVKLKAKITFTPTNGDPATQTKKLTLKRS
jgi:hypothetical protein